MPFFIASWRPCVQIIQAKAQFYSTLCNNLFFAVSHFNTIPERMINNIAAPASASSIILLLYLSCAHPSNTVIYITGILPNDESSEYLVATFFLPIANNTTAVNAVYTNPTPNVYNNTPVIYTHGWYGITAMIIGMMAHTSPKNR